MKKAIFTITLTSVFLLSCKTNSNSEVSILKTDKKAQEVIIENCMAEASKYMLYSRERAEELDKGLKIDSTIAYLWQQKAMPLFKQGKYEIGMKFIDKAVIYDRNNYQEYRAFIKCIFAKTYQEAIQDFEDCKIQNGNSYVMDHSYDFHIALSYLQLNEFEKAEEIFKNDIETLRKSKGDDWVHHLDLFYYGISIYEQKKYEEAIIIFDLALLKYPNFSDVQFYKTLSLFSLGKNEEAKILFELGKSNNEKGYTINEDNVSYEKYPYQIVSW